MNADEVLRKRGEFVMPCLGHFYRRPPLFVRGEMQYLYDVDGNRYLDCQAGVSVINCGHCNAAIVERVCAQARTLQHVCNIYLTSPMAELAERLAAATPGALRKSFFCSTGTEANEGALLLAALYTRRPGIVALRSGLHGRTKLGMSVTGLAMWRTDPRPLSEVSFAPDPYCYRCPLALTYPECDLECANRVETLLAASAEGVGAFLAEPIMGNAGIIVPPPGYFRRVREILAAHGALLLVDEVQSGFARSGTMFAIEQHGVVPDIMSVAKALGNGVPISAFIATADVADVYTQPGASTLGGNPVSATAGLAVLDYLAANDLAAKARVRGAQLRDGLRGLARRHPCIGDVRGLGLMLGAELVKPNGEPDAARTDDVLEALMQRGFIVGKNGRARNVLAFQPPLVISAADIDALLTALDDVLRE